MRPSTPRPSTTGPDNGPAPPFPIRLSGPVIKGFGRGSKELGIPTANIPAEEGLAAYPDLEVGVYYGVVALDWDSTAGAGAGARTTRTRTGIEGEEGTIQSLNNSEILPAVLSIGYNPFYKNERKSIEIHILPPLSAPSATMTKTTIVNNDNGEQGKKEEEKKEVKFNKLPDFYGTKLNLLMLGYIRPEYDYVSLDALIEDIRVDCEVARASLLRPGYQVYLGGGEGEGEREEVRREREWLWKF